MALDDSTNATTTAVLVLLATTTWMVVDACSSSSCLERVQQLRIQAIKKTILAELGMNAPPNTRRIKLPSAQMRKEFQRIAAADGDDNGHAHFETAFSTALRVADRDVDVATQTAEFAVDDSVASQRVRGLRLSVFLDVDDVPTSLIDGDNGTQIVVDVFERTANGSLGGRLGTSIVRVTSSRRVFVDLRTDEFERWYLGGQTLGIFVEALLGRRNVAVHPQRRLGEYAEMILTVKYSKSSRERRSSAPVCPHDRPASGCCLYDMIIDFEKIGWHWIIAPPRFNAYFCRGDCSANGHHVHRYGHTKIIKAITRNNSTMHSVIEKIGSCCHPTDYEQLQVIYVNRAGIISSASVQGMVARQCSCS